MKKRDASVKPAWAAALAARPAATEPAQPEPAQPYPHVPLIQVDHEPEADLVWEAPTPQPPASQGAGGIAGNGIAGNMNKSLAELMAIAQAEYDAGSAL